MTEVDTAVPVCETCKRDTRRTGSRFGKGIYTCTNDQCPDRFRVKYERGSRRKGTSSRKVFP